MMSKKLKDPNFQQNNKFCFAILLIGSAQITISKRILQKKKTNCRLRDTMFFKKQMRLLFPNKEWQKLLQSG